MALGITQSESPIKVTSPLGTDKLMVRTLSGEEYISGIYRYSVDFISEDNDLNFEDIVGKDVTIGYELADGTIHNLNGVVGRFAHLGKDPRVAVYRAEIYPWLWLTTMNSDCRIFQNKSVLEILKQVFSGLGFTDIVDNTTATYTAREFCVQYNETSFAFVSRLMEEEGIFYFFEHDSSGHKLVLADDGTAFSPIAGEPTIPVRTHEFTDGPGVIDCHIERAVTVGQFKSTDYNFETPATNLLVTASADDTARSVYEYPGNLGKKNELEARAKLMLEGHEAEGKVLRGQARAPHMRPGYKFTLARHTREEANAEWVVRSLAFRLDQNGDYSSSFEAFPAATSFRPARRTPRPRIYGAQTATVVGKSGEEIWTDKYGRVKVKFHWDQESKSDENSSCWIRVAQGWAGKSWGSMFIPRIDQEVVVSFLDGDPDRPLITGCVYNGAQTVPYTLPSEQTKSTIKSNSSKGGAGFNEFRFEDKKDSEEVFLQAQKDFNVNVLNDQTTTVKNSRKTTVQEKDDTLIVDKGNRTIKVNTGNETHEVKGTRDVTVTGKETHTDKADFEHKVAGNYTLKVDGDITIEATGRLTIKSGMDFKAEAGTAMAQKSATEFKCEAGTDMTAKAGMNMNIEAGMNLSAKGGIGAEVKGSASVTVDGGGMLALKGGMIKLN